MNSHGYLAQFTSPDDVLAAVPSLQAAGFTRLEAYTPYAVEGLADALGAAPRRIPAAMLAGGLFGALATLGLQYYSAVIDYPIDVGGRPNASWPAFIPAVLEMAILFAVIAGVLAMLWGNGLPRLYHPLFNVEWFEAASADGFLLLVRADDPAWDPLAAAAALRDCGCVRLAEVPR